MSNPLELDKQVIAKANDRQVGGSHYRSQYQHWDLATDTMMRHLEGASSKYLSRFGNKVGEPASKDLEKAEHYIEKLIEVAKFNADFEPLAVIQSRAQLDPRPFVDRFLEGLSGPPTEESNITVLRTLSNWQAFCQLEDCLLIVKSLRQYHASLEKQAAAIKGMD